MRLWSLHPRYLDRVGLVACWREALLALKVLRGKTKGYRNHPQLERFKSADEPVRAIRLYLLDIWREAEGRGYHFDYDKLGLTPGEAAGPPGPQPSRISVSKGQLDYELDHLRQKLIMRDPWWLGSIAPVESPEPHPLFNVSKGGIEPWETVPAGA